MVKYTLAWRHNTATSWQLIDQLMDLEEAQRRLFNRSEGSPFQWDIIKCESILADCHRNINEKAPELVKGRTPADDN